MTLSLLPLAAWFFDEVRRDHQQGLATALDAVAAEHKMVRLKE
jgi:hypothetical protein